MLEHKEEREEPLFLKGENSNIGKKAIGIEQDLGTVGAVPLVHFLRFCHVNFFSWDGSVFFS